MAASLQTDTQKPFHRRRRFPLALVALVPLMFIILSECGHLARFGDFFGYGYHVDLVLDHSDIGVPRKFSAHCLRVANYTLHPLKFEAIQTPTWGITDGQLIFHDRIEKWSERTHSWLTVNDSLTTAEPSLRTPNTTKNVWPGESVYPTGCYEMATVEGINKGNAVRLVAFTSYSNSEGGHDQLAFYSQPFIVKEESLGKEPSFRNPQK